MIDMGDEQPARRRRLTRAESQARTREQLLDAAATVFAEKGFDGSSIEEIAETAGYSTGAMYSNFESKEQLFLELLDTRRTRGAAVRLDAVTLLFESQMVAGEDSLEALTRLFVEVADRDREFAPLQAEFWLYAVRHPDAMSVIATHLRYQVDAFERLISHELARRNITLGISAREVTTVVLGLFHGLVRQRRVEPAAVPDDLFARSLGWLFGGLASVQGPLSKETPDRSH